MKSDFNIVVNPFCFSFFIFLGCISNILGDLCICVLFIHWFVAAAIKKTYALFFCFQSLGF